MTDFHLADKDSLTKFKTIDNTSLSEINGGIVICGVVIAGAVAIKIGLAGAATGAAAVGIYYTSKR